MRQKATTPTPRLRVDPPEVARFAKRGDPPISRWPGRLVSRQDIMEAAGDPRDWFRYGHRLDAYRKAWAEFVDARRRRKNFIAGFDWNQILILGDYGAGKTTLAIKLARYYFGLGHPVFSNASCLFGWHLEHEEMYTAMGFMPANSVLLIDESSAHLASRVGHGVAVSSFQEMNLNSRKRNCITVYMTAHDWELPASIRRNCKEVWMPVPSEDIDVEDTSHETGKRPAPRDERSPDNFRMAYHVWDDYPYRKANLIEGRDADKGDGFGPPTHTMYDEGERVRDAYMLNDTFQLAAAGAATMADRDVVKEQLADFHKGIRPNGRGNDRDPSSDRMEKLLLFLQEHADDPPRFFRAADIARGIGVNSSLAGRLLQEIIPVSPIQNKGYPTNVIYEHLEKIEKTLKESEEP